MPLEGLAAGFAAAGAGAGLETGTAVAPEYFGRA